MFLHKIVVLYISSFLAILRIKYIGLQVCIEYQIDFLILIETQLFLLSVFFYFYLLYPYSCSLFTLLVQINKLKVSAELLS